MKEIDGIPKHQSAYRRGHSTETALLKVINDLQLSADRGEVRALCLLNLSTTFLSWSTISCCLLGCEVGLGWLARCLTGSNHIYRVGPIYFVTYDSSMSDVVHLVACSVPQGSVLGPLLFVLHTAELENIAAEKGVNIAYICMRMILNCISTARRQTQPTPTPSWNDALLS